MTDPFFISILLVISTTAMTVMLITGRIFAIRLRFTNPKMVNLVFFFALYKVIAYYGLPLFLEICSDFRYVKEDSIELLSLFNLYVIELVSWVFWLMGMLVVAT